jgi:hypothetical protein
MTADCSSRHDPAGPIFLAGADRSGIGLLGDLLDQHPAFALSRRTNFWTFYDGRFGDLTDPASLDRCISAMMRFRRIRDLGVDPDRLRSEFLESPDRDYARLFALIGEQHAAGRGKPRWGDKSLNSEHHADRILGAYPTARMIQVIRDPRDRHASVTSHRGGKRGGVASSSAEWRDSIRWAERNLATHPDRYRVIRYEDLVADPTVVIGSVCDFVGEPLDAASLTPPSQHGGTGPPIHTRSVGRFRLDVDSRQVAFIERTLSEEMARHGYQITGPPLGAMEQGALLVYLPLGRLLMALRGPWSTIRSRITSRPSRRRLVA